MHRAQMAAAGSTRPPFCPAEACRTRHARPMRFNGGLTHACTAPSTPNRSEAVLSHGVPAASSVSPRARVAALAHAVAHGDLCAECGPRVKLRRNADSICWERWELLMVQKEADATPVSVVMMHEPATYCSTFMPVPCFPLVRMLSPCLIHNSHESIKALHLQHHY
jgi:hypothetical protein